MNILQKQKEQYLEYCQLQKRLDLKTLKAYRIDLTQFIERLTVDNLSEITPDLLEKYIGRLHQYIGLKQPKEKLHL